MCGFAGFIDLGKNLPSADLTRIVDAMGDTIAHRGPDDAASWSDPAAGVAVAFRRLAIIDLSAAGRQPMVSASGNLVVACNGEIYNAPELRRELAAQGVVFRGHSDTEVMLEAFDHWGLGPTLDRLNGMFAIALWDRRDRALHMMRDRFGEKPLYYGRIGSTFFFGSQPKAFRPHPAWRTEIDRDSLAAFMRFGYVPSPGSIFRNIYKLRPAEWIEVAGDRIGKGSIYWNLKQIGIAAQKAPLDLEDAEGIERLETLLLKSVKDRMLSDVPLGAFLSGGIDSSLVVALMQKMGPKPVKTFSIGFEDPNYDESGYARAVANHLRTDHHDLIVRPGDARDVIPKIPLYFDEPFADASQIPTYLLCAMTRRHVSVALSGDGGDELFAGYPRYWAAQTISGIPPALRASLRLATRALPSRAWNILGTLAPRYGSANLASRAQRLAGILENGKDERIFQDLVGQWPRSPPLVRGGQLREDPVWEGELACALPARVRRMQLVDALTYLPDDILVKCDRASMAVGLEMRVPMLDRHFVEATLALPDRFMSRGGQTKWLLRQILYRHVPRELIDRPKMGFMLPIGDWLRGPLRGWAEDLLEPRRLEAEGLLDPEPIRQTWQSHLHGQSNWQYRLWCVLMFQAWKQHAGA